MIAFAIAFALAFFLGFDFFVLRFEWKRRNVGEVAVLRKCLLLADYHLCAAFTDAFTDALTDGRAARPSPLNLQCILFEAIPASSIWICVYHVPSQIPSWDIMYYPKI